MRAVPVELWLSPIQLPDIKETKVTCTKNPHSQLLRPQSPDVEKAHRAHRGSARRAHARAGAAPVRKIRCPKSILASDEHGTSWMAWRGGLPHCVVDGNVLCRRHRKGVVFLEGDSVVACPHRQMLLLVCGTFRLNSWKAGTHFLKKLWKETVQESLKTSKGGIHAVRRETGRAGTSRRRPRGTCPHAWPEEEARLKANKNEEPLELSLSPGLPPVQKQSEPQLNPPVQTNTLLARRPPERPLVSVRHGPRKRSDTVPRWAIRGGKRAWAVLGGGSEDPKRAEVLNQ